MSLGLQGYNYVLPPTQSGGAGAFARQLENNRQNLLLQQQMYWRQQQAMQQQQDELAGFVATQLGDKNFATGTPYDGNLNTMLTGVREKWANAIKQNPRMSKADLVMGMSKDIGDVNAYAQNARNAKENIENTLKEYSKIPGFDEGKFRSLLYGKVFFNPDKSLKPGGELKFAPEDIESAAMDIVFEAPDNIITTTEPIDKFIKTFEPVTVDGRYRNTFADRSMAGKQVKVKYNPAFYEVSPDDIDESGIIKDIDKIQFKPLTYDQIAGDKRLMLAGVKLAKQRLAGQQYTPEEFNQVMTDEVNNYIKTRTPIDRGQVTLSKEAPTVNVTVRNNSNEPAEGYDPNNIFDMIEKGDPKVTPVLISKKGMGATPDTQQEEWSLGSIVQSFDSPYITKEGDKYVPFEDIRFSKDGTNVKVILEKPDRNNKRYYVFKTDSQEWQNLKANLVTQPGYKRVRSALTGKKPLIQFNRK